MRIVEAVHDDVHYRGHPAFATGLQFQRRAVTSLRGDNDGSLAGALSLAIDVNNLKGWARCFNNAQALNGNGGATPIATLHLPLSFSRYFIPPSLIDIRSLLPPPFRPVFSSPS